MSLSAREQQALDSIEERLAGSDPQLASLLASFSGLASGEQMPVHETVRAGSWRAIGDRWHGRRRGTRNTPRRHASLMRPRAGFRRAALLLYLLITIVLIAVGLAVGLGSSSSSSGCPRPFGVPCVSSAHARSPRPGAHDRAASKTPDPVVHIERQG